MGLPGPPWRVGRGSHFPSNLRDGPRTDCLESLGNSLSAPPLGSGSLSPTHPPQLLASSSRPLRGCFAHSGTARSPSLRPTFALPHWHCWGRAVHFCSPHSPKSSQRVQKSSRTLTRGRSWVKPALSLPSNAVTPKVCQLRDRTIGGSLSDGGNSSELVDLH